MDEIVTTLNNCLSNPGLVISAGSSALAKWANTFQFKANGRISAPITTANAPSLASAPIIPAVLVNGASPVAGVLATGFSRIYTLIATLAVNGTGTVTPTFSWIASADFATASDLPYVGTFGDPNQSNQTVIGALIVANATGSNFVPGTTALDTASLTVTYLNNFGVTGS